MEGRNLFFAGSGQVFSDRLTPNRFTEFIQFIRILLRKSPLRSIRINVRSSFPARTLRLCTLALAFCFDLALLAPAQIADQQKSIELKLPPVRCKIAPAKDAVRWGGTPAALSAPPAPITSGDRSMPTSPAPRQPRAEVGKQDRKSQIQELVRRGDTKNSQAGHPLILASARNVGGAALPSWFDFAPLAPRETLKTAPRKMSPAITEASGPGKAPPEGLAVTKAEGDRSLSATPGRPASTFANLSPVGSSFAKATEDTAAKEELSDKSLDRAADRSSDKSPVTDESGSPEKTQLCIPKPHPRRGLKLVPANARSAIVTSNTGNGVRPNGERRLGEPGDGTFGSVPWFLTRHSSEPTLLAPVQIASGKHSIEPALVKAHHAGSCR